MSFSPIDKSADFDIDFHLNLLMQLPGYIAVTDKESRCVYANKITANLFGFKNEDVIQGVSIYDVRCPAVESASEFQAQDKMVISTGNSLTVLNIHEYAQSDSKILLTKKLPYRSRKNNEIIGTICHSIEIQADALSQACAALIQSDKKYQHHKNGNRSYEMANHLPKKQLSEREMECVFYLMRGNTMKQIAKALNISPRTVETYLEQIKVKLNCSSRSDIVDYCLAEGLINYIPQGVYANGFSKIIHVH